MATNAVRKEISVPNQNQEAPKNSLEPSRPRRSYTVDYLEEHLHLFKKATTARNLYHDRTAFEGAQIMAIQGEKNRASWSRQWSNSPYKASFEELKKHFFASGLYEEFLNTNQLVESQ